MVFVLKVPKVKGPLTWKNCWLRCQFSVGVKIKLWNELQTSNLSILFSAYMEISLLQLHANSSSQKSEKIKASDFHHLSIGLSSFIILLCLISTCKGTIECTWRQLFIHKSLSYFWSSFTNFKEKQGLSLWQSSDIGFNAMEGKGRA